jgi:hypothetical protein
MTAAVDTYRPADMGHELEDPVLAAEVVLLVCHQHHLPSPRRASRDHSRFPQKFYSPGLNSYPPRLLAP